MNSLLSKFKKYFTPFILLVCTGGAATVSAGDLVPFSASYDATLKGFAIKAERQLKHLENDRYELVFTAKALVASINETSVFSVNDGNIQSINYHYTQKALGKNRKNQSTFEKTAEDTVTINSDSGSITSDLKTLDPLNYQLQLQQDLQKGLKTFQHTIASKGQLKSYHYEVVGNEIIETNLGKLNTIKVKVLHKDNHKISYTWHAPELNHLLVQLQQYENDKLRLSLLLNQANLNNTAVTGQ